MNLLVSDLIDFIILHKGETTFIGYNENQIASLIRRGIQEDSLWYSLDLDGNITGMILAEIDHKKKVVFVTENLAITLSNLIMFAQRARKQFHGYAIEAIRHGNLHRKYNTNKLYKKLCQDKHQEAIKVPTHS